jgi:glycosyltransferase involved in cell wall biosynthesis
MRVIHTIASTRLDHGGTSRSVPALCDALAELGVDVHLVAGRPADERVPCGWPKDVRRVHAIKESSRVRAWGIGSKFRETLAKLCSGTGDDGRTIIHDHGLWLATNHAAATFARSRRGVFRVVSPRGMLAAWSMRQGKFKKRTAWHAYQRRDLASAQAFHATSGTEAAEIRNLGLTQPIGVVPNGIRFPETIARTAGADGRRMMLFLSRIHPKKGLLNLMRAWKAAAPPPEWRLVIAGPDEGGHRAELERAVADMEIGDQVSFPGEIADADKWRWYASADVFVLPSFSENFGLVVAESLAAGTPVITTTGTPWRDMATHQCGWWVEPSQTPLSEAIREAYSLMPEEREAMGARGAAWAREDFAWERAARDMRAFYEDVFNA